MKCSACKQLLVTSSGEVPYDVCPHCDLAQCPGEKLCKRCEGMRGQKYDGVGPGALPQ